MIEVLERLRELRVADVLRPSAVSVSPHQTMAEAASVLCDSGVSGAPVVDESGHCVGVLTAQDYLRWAAATDDFARPAAGLRGGLFESPPATLLSERERDCVARHMSTAVQPISETASLLGAARMMCAAHVHRLPVLDRAGAVVGVVEALDVVAALAGAAEEVTS